MIKLLAFNFDQVFVAKPNFLEKLDRMVSTFSVQFPKQMNEAIANLKVLFQKFLVYAEAHPWLMPSLIVGGIVLVLWWLYYLSTLDYFVQLPHRRLFMLPNFLRKLRFRFGRRRKKYKY